MAQIYSEFQIKRCRRPKLDWFREFIKEATHAFGMATPPEIIQQDLEIVIRAANSRQGPFKQRPSALGLTKYKVNAMNQPLARRLEAVQKPLKENILFFSHAVHLYAVPCLPALRQLWRPGGCYSQIRWQSVQNPKRYENQEVQTPVPQHCVPPERSHSSVQPAVQERSRMDPQLDHLAIRSKPCCS